MILRALKHFILVGVVFSFVLGWVLTIAVNVPLGSMFQSVVGGRPTDSYVISLFLTVVSLALIMGATILGNRLYRMWFGPSSVSLSALRYSTVLFTVLVLWRVGPELASTLDNAAGATSYFYNHPWHFLGVFSLPLARLICIPLAYFLIGRNIFPPPTQPELVTAKSTASGERSGT